MKKDGARVDAGKGGSQADAGKKDGPPEEGTLREVLAAVTSPALKVDTQGKEMDALRQALWRCETDCPVSRRSTARSRWRVTGCRCSAMCGTCPRGMCGVSRVRRRGLGR